MQVPFSLLLSPLSKDVFAGPLVTRTDWRVGGHPIIVQLVVHHAKSKLLPKFEHGNCLFLPHMGPSLPCIHLRQGANGK